MFCFFKISLLRNYKLFDLPVWWQGCSNSLGNELCIVSELIFPHWSPPLPPLLKVLWVITAPGGLLLDGSPGDSCPHGSSLSREPKLEGVWQVRWGGHDGRQIPLCIRWIQRAGERKWVWERAEIFMINDFTGQCRASALSPWGASGLSQCARRSKLTAPRWVISEHYLNVHTHSYTFYIYIYMLYISFSLTLFYSIAVLPSSLSGMSFINGVWFILYLSHVHNVMMTSARSSGLNGQRKRR